MPPIGGAGKPFRTIIFDFDGTLAELHIDFDEMKRRIEALALEYIPADWQPPLPPVLEFTEYLKTRIKAARDGLSEEFAARAAESIVGVEMEAAAVGRLFPHTRDMLGLLRSMGVNAGVITRNCENAVLKVLGDLRPFIPVLLCRDHVPKVKPDPDHLLRAIRMIGGEPGESLMVGDHPLDIQTGKRAGVATAGVASGRVSEAVLAASGADWTAPDCSVLIRKLIQSDLL